MRRLLAACLLTLAAAPAAHADEIVVLDDPSASVATETRQRQQALGGFAVEHRFTHGIEGFVAELTARQVAELRRDPEVAAIVPNRPVWARQTETLVPPGIRRVTTDEPNMVRRAASGAVAVVDTGIDLAHPELNAVAGKNCKGSGPPADGDGHGTHVAGTIGARNDGSGVVGVAPDTKLYAVKVLDDEGRGTLGDVICGLDWVLANAAAKGIVVVNLSLGGPGVPGTTCNPVNNQDPSHPLFCRLAAAGVTPVVAAGNEGADFSRVPDDPQWYDCPGGLASCPDSPAGFPEVLTVAAMTDTDGISGGGGADIVRSVAGSTTCDAGSALNGDDRYASFSNYATTEADAAHLVAAPGMCVESTLPGNRTGFAHGTSMAAPHVAAVVALCKGEAGASGPCAGMGTVEIIEHLRAGGPGSEFTGVSGRVYGPLAMLRGAGPGVAEATVPAPLAVRPSAQQGEPEPQSPSTPIAPTAAATTAPAPGPAPRPIAPAPPDAAGTGRTPTVPRLAFATGRLATLRRLGLRVRLRCAAPCRGTVRLRVTRATARRLRLRTTTLGSVRVRRAATVTVRLTRAARHALARRRALTATVVADLRSGARDVRVSKRLRARR